MHTCPNTLDELVVDMELNPDKYQHLQFILNRQKHMNLGFGQLYLVVNDDGFGLYRLDNVDYDSGVIRLSFTNPDTKNKAEILLDINNKHPKIFLINWKDIEDMGCPEYEFGELENE
ncbi:MAG: hypothetical protein EPN88_06365 [Bacteroidetes bacterium]|nr:MAG: hypothetical protein EPN88_06365 [Bacteroidota bacterium]